MILGTAYHRVLRRAYGLELLGEAVYRQAARHLSDPARQRQWLAFAETEARMRELLSQELRRRGARDRLPGLVSGLLQGVAAVAVRLPAAWLDGLIEEILERRRYARWATRYAAQNPSLWQRLVEHEQRQVEHFEQRRPG